MVRQSVGPRLRRLTPVQRPKHGQLSAKTTTNLFIYGLKREIIHTSLPSGVAKCTGSTTSPVDSWELKSQTVPLTLAPTTPFCIWPAAFNAMTEVNGPESDTVSPSTSTVTVLEAIAADTLSCAACKLVHSASCRSDAKSRNTARHNGAR